MRVLLAWLIQFAWLFYALCGLGALLYIVRALSLQNRLGESLTTFERETTVARVARYWRTAVAFIVLGVTIFAAQAVLLPRISAEELLLTTPTLAGLITSTPAPTATASPIAGALPTVAATAAVPLPPPPSPPPASTPTPTPGPVPSVALGIRLGNVAELIGYDVVSTQVNTSEGAQVILYWRALDGAAGGDYWVFTHLRTPDGRLVAQHDSAPVNGMRPTTGWTTGEIILDAHRMIFKPEEAGYSGTAEIAVGLYNPTAPEMRVPVEGGGDYVSLPTLITVVGP